MRLRREFYKESVLAKFGFVFEKEKLDWAGLLLGRYVCEIGHSRRGQFYYLTIHPETFEIYVYANEADGQGTHIMIGDVLFRMIEKGMVEMNDD